MASSSLERAEHRLLLRGARTRLRPGEAEEFRRLAAGPLDWDYLFALARRHFVLPLLYRQLNANAAHEVPPAQLRRLRDNFREHTARNLYLTGELLRIVDLFESEGVPVVPFKGPALAACAYGDTALRRFVDLDILVRREDLSKARELLARRGLRQEWRLTPAQERVLLRAQHNLPFRREGEKLFVELHWAFAGGGFAAGDEAVWSRLVNLKLGGREVRGLAPEDLLPSLCVHGAKHLWERLAWVCDVAELINSHPRLDWPAALSRARAGRTERMLLLGLRLAGELLDAEVPDELARRAAAEPGLSGLAERAAARLFDGAEHRPPGLRESLGFNLSLRRGFGERLRYLGFVCTPTDGDLTAVSLPPALTFGYYLVRPFRLLLKGEAGH